MFSKLGLITIGITSALLGGFLFIKYHTMVTEIARQSENIVSPLSNTTSTKPTDKPKDYFSFSDIKLDTKPIGILLMGIDRRSKSETGFRTDIMILVIINPITNQVAMISVPRDLWYDHGRINAEYVKNGWEGMQSAFTEITGIKPDKYILTDFEDFKWLVDAFDGVKVDIQNTFTDTEFPVDETKGYQTVTFKAGEELMTGERALIFARSRHGNNGEGSDFMRMRRQHLILKSLAYSEIKPRKLLTPENIKLSYETIVNHGIETNLTLDDAMVLWDLIKDRAKYKITSILLDSQFLYNPPMSEYGGAWVLVPINNSFDVFHKYVNDVINNTLPIAQEATTSANNH